MDGHPPRRHFPTTGPRLAETGQRLRRAPACSIDHSAGPLVRFFFGRAYVGRVGSLVRVEHAQPGGLADQTLPRKTKIFSPGSISQTFPRAILITALSDARTR